MSSELTEPPSRAAPIPRGLADTIVEAMRHARAVALLGPRQAGKSTLARMLAPAQPPAAFLTLDDETTRSIATSDPEGLVAGLGERTVIDEVQRAPNLLLAIKSRLDRNDRPGQFLLTGSANLRRIPTVADALPGRVDYVTLWPFAQAEIEGRTTTALEYLLDGAVPTLKEVKRVGRAAYSEVLLAGGFPEALRRPAPSRRRFFDSYLTTIVERDIADISRVHDPTAAASLLRLIAARSGSLARYDRLGRDAGIDGKTAKAHVEVLERLFLVRIRRAWHVNLGKRQVKAPKLYVADPGLLGSLLGADEARVREDDGFAGALFETFVATELERQASWYPEPLSFWHYREGEHEVDVVIERPSGTVLGVEVKAGATVRQADFRGLVQMRERLGNRLALGVVLHAGEQTLRVADRLWALPLEALWSS